MPSAFNFAISPFDALTSEQKSRLRGSIDIAYYPDGAVVLEAGAETTCLWVTIKGHVAQMDGKDTIAIHGPEDVWDGRALVAGRSSHRFVASEELLAYQLPREVLMALIAENDTFGALLFADLGQKLSALSQRSNTHEMQSLTLSRVDEAFLRPAQVVDAQDDVLSVVRVLHAHDARAVLVRDMQVTPPALGIFTQTALQEAVLDGRPLSAVSVREFARFALLSVRPSDTMGDALALLTRHRIHRLVVAEGDQVFGLLEALDVFGFLSGQSQQLGLLIDDAGTVEALAQAAAQMNGLLARLHRSGTRVGLIARLVQDLQTRLFERAWALVAPPELVANSCLFVMGSEGRGEQLLKTDQDNALVLRDGYTPPVDLAEICARFSAALAAFGYPPCPGQIMVSNPEWRHTETEFAQQVRQWLLMPEADALMKLAIFLDAHAVAGDAVLLARLQQAARSNASHSDALLARFASAIDAFGSTQGWWNRLMHLGDAPTGMHLKKEGIFPLVHGVRSLAFQAGLTETGTVARLNALATRGVISATQAGDWAQCLQFLMAIKLKAGLADIDLAQPVNDTVDVSRLSTLERDLLKDALDVVRQFKAFLRRHFRLDVL
jgi:CBS domain-containing protein